MEKVIAIYGPTTSGKLSLALHLSKYIWGKFHLEPEIVNTDSRKIYQGFIISQSLPLPSLSSKNKLHLFGEVPPKEKLNVDQVRDLILQRVEQVVRRNSVPILVGGSPLHLLAVLDNLANQSNAKTLLIIQNASKNAIRRAIAKNVSQMFQKGLYNEFRDLYQRSLSGQVSLELLNETLGYRQFIEMGKVSRKSPSNLDKTDLDRVKAWIVKDIFDYARHQILALKKFPNKTLIKNFREAKYSVDDFLS